MCPNNNGVTSKAHQQNEVTESSASSDGQQRKTGNTSLSSSYMVYIRKYCNESIKQKMSRKLYKVHFGNKVGRH